MSIPSEIERIAANISAAYNAVREKGGSVPEQANSNNLAAAIAAIPASEGSGDTYLNSDSDFSGYAFLGVLKTVGLSFVNVSVEDEIELLEDTYAEDSEL